MTAWYLRRGFGGDSIIYIWQSPPARCTELGMCLRLQTTNSSKPQTCLSQLTQSRPIQDPPPRDSVSPAVQWGDGPEQGQWDQLCRDAENRGFYSEPQC